MVNTSASDSSMSTKGNKFLQACIANAMRNARRSEVKFPDIYYDLCEIRIIPVLLHEPLTSKE